MKKLYEFKINETFIDKVEEKTDGGTFIRDVESTREKECFIKLPQRREIDQIRIIQSAEFGKAVGMGLQTRESMRTAILNNGGFEYAKRDIEEVDRIAPILNEKRNAYMKALVDKEPTEELEAEINEMSSFIDEIQTRLLQVYEHSAETLAERETIIWAILNLSFWADNTPVFAGNTDESRKTRYYEIFDEDKANLPELQVFTAAYLVLDAYLYKGFSPDEIKTIMTKND